MLLQGGDVDDSEDPNLAVITTKQIQCDLAAAEATVAAWELGHHTPAPLTADEIREALDHAGRVISTVDPQARHMHKSVSDLPQWLQGAYRA